MQKFFVQPSLKHPLFPQARLSLRVHSSSPELFCFSAACAGRMLVSIAPEHACFALIPIGIVSMSIGIGAMQTRFPAAATGFQPEQSGSAAHDAAFRLAAIPARVQNRAVLKT